MLKKRRTMAGTIIHKHQTWALITATTTMTAMITMNATAVKKKENINNVATLTTALDLALLSLALEEALTAERKQTAERLGEITATTMTADQQPPAKLTFTFPAVSKSKTPTESFN